MSPKCSCEYTLQNAVWYEHIFTIFFSTIWRILTYSYTYRKSSSASCTKSQTLNVSRFVLQLSLPNPSRVISREWRFSWSSADRRCSNYIWINSKFIAYWGVSYIRGWRYMSIICAIVFHIQSYCTWGIIKAFAPCLNVVHEIYFKEMCRLVHDSSIFVQCN